MKPKVLDDGKWTWHEVHNGLGEVRQGSRVVAQVVREADFKRMVALDELLLSAADVIDAYEANDSLRHALRGLYRAMQDAKAVRWPE